MKRLIALTVVLVMVSAAVIVLAANEDKNKTNMIESSKETLAMMNKIATRMDQELLQARKEQNTRKIECIGDRLTSLRKLIGESDGLMQKLRAFSMQQRTAEARETFARLRHNRQLAVQLIKMVENCFRNINAEGGFVETIEEWIGTLENEQADDPTETGQDPTVPEPLPSEFTPGPVSEENEEG